MQKSESDHMRQARSRAMAEARTSRSMLQVMVCASLLRAYVTGLLPTAGAASWWMLLVLLLPGMMITMLLRIMMKKCSIQSLPQLIEQAFGIRYGRFFLLPFVVLLLCDALQTLVVLVCFFTEGIGTQGTQFTIALLTALMAIFCLRNDGLPRGIHLLRWVLLIMLGIVVAGWGGSVSRDGLYPWQGDGWQVLKQALMQQAGISWPLLLLLLPPGHEKQQHSISPIITPLMVVVLASLAITLSIPHRIFTSSSALGATVLLPFSFLPAAVRMVAYCLLMTSMFLLLCANAYVAASLIRNKKERTGLMARWLIGLLCLCMIPAVNSVWSILRWGQRMVAPILLLMLFMLGVIAWLRSKRRRA